MVDPFDGRTGPPAPATRIRPRSLELSFTQPADGRTGSARSHAERRTPQWRELLTEWRAREASDGRRKARTEGSGHTRRMAATAPDALPNAPGPKVFATGSKWAVSREFSRRAPVRSPKPDRPQRLQVLTRLYVPGRLLTRCCARSRRSRARSTSAGGARFAHRARGDAQSEQRWRHRSASEIPTFGGRRELSTAGATSTRFRSAAFLCVPSRRREGGRSSWSRTRTSSSTIAFAGRAAESSSTRPSVPSTSRARGSVT